MTILITGAAGFIGFHISQKLLSRGENVIGLDELNAYYDVNLKQARLEQLQKYSNFQFVRLNLAEVEATTSFFQQHQQIEQIIHLAAQAGVRYSLTHPFAYAQANLVGHLAVLEGARSLPELKHMIYASSSSVYGSNTKLPFAVGDPTDHPISLYAATKKSAELMSDCYNHLYKLPLSGLRYFTVYGPWGRPDMSAFLFTEAIIKDRAMIVFNNGNMRRNFTYIDDIVEGTIGCLDKKLTNDHRIYNIGNNLSESLLDFIATLENIIGKTAIKRFEALQPGDVVETIADINEATKDFGFMPKTNIKEGLQKFVSWYQEYYNNLN